MLFNTDIFWYILDMSGTAVFAFSGALAAARKHMDLFGIIVVSFVTAVGGGTFRDLLLGRKVFWLDDHNYLAIATISALSVFLLLRNNIAKYQKLLLLADAIGLGIFTVIGVEKALQQGMGSIIAVFMGTLTGIGGGITRDILCCEHPVVLHRDIYALIATGGGILFLLLSNLQVASIWCSTITIFAITVMRIFFLIKRSNLPAAIKDCSEVNKYPDATSDND